MRDKKIKKLFMIIDYGIKVFNADKGFRVDASERRDWLVFDQRSLGWSKNGLDYLLQIFPHFNDQEKIISWTLYGAVSYDTETDRYLTSFSPAREVALDFIALKAAKLLNETYDYICTIKKEDIPHAVEFTN